MGRMTRNHQPDQADFRVILPEDIDWKPFPAFAARSKWIAFSKATASSSLDGMAGPQKLQPFQTCENLSKNNGHQAEI
jgi:hypothetical protein